MAPLKNLGLSRLGLKVRLDQYTYVRELFILLEQKESSQGRVRVSPYLGNGVTHGQ